MNSKKSLISKRPIIHTMNSIKTGFQEIECHTVNYKEPIENKVSKLADYRESLKL